MTETTDTSSQLPLPKLMARLASNDLKRQRSAVKAVTTMDPRSVTPLIVDSLVRLLSSHHPLVRRSTLFALTSLGELAATPVATTRVLDLISGSLIDGDGWPSEALQLLTESAFRTQIRGRLLKLKASSHRSAPTASSSPSSVPGSGNDSPFVHGSVCDGLSASEPRVSDARLWVIALMLEHPQPARRQAILETVLKLGNDAALLPIPEQLTNLLRDDEEPVRRMAKLALFSLRESAINTPVLLGLAATLNDSRGSVRVAAGKILGKLTAGDGASQVGALLLDLLDSKDDWIRRWAVAVMGSLEPSAVPPAALERMVDLLGDADPSVRRWAAWALGRVGGHSVAQRAIEQLGRMLQFEAPEVARVAATALASLGRSTDTLAAHSHIEQAVAPLLDGKDPRRLELALITLGGIGPAVASAALHDRLIPWTQEADPMLRRWATWAYHTLGYHDATAHRAHLSRARVRRGASTSEQTRRTPMYDRMP